MGEEVSALFDVAIENPLGSRVRMQYDPERGWVEGAAFDKPLPAEYGYALRTRNPADGEEADVLVVGYGPTFSGCRYQARAIGLLLRTDGDHKLLAVPHTPEYISPLRDVGEVDPVLLQQIEDWFRPYFELIGWRDAQWALEWLGVCRAAAG